MNTKGLDYLANLRLFSRFVDGSWFWLCSALIFAMIAAFCEILPVWLLSQVIDETMQGTITTDRSNDIALLMFGAIAASFVSAGLSAALGHLVAFKAILRMRIAILDHMARVPLGHLGRYRKGDAKRLILDDPEALEGLFAHGLPDSVGALCLLATISIWLIAIDPFLATSAMLPAVAGLGALAIAMRRSVSLAVNFQAASMRMNASILQFLGGIAVLKIFKGGIGTDETRRAVNDHTRSQTVMSVDYIPFGAVFTTLIASNVAFILPVGLLRVQQGAVEPAALFFAIVLGVAYGSPLLKLFAQFHRFASISLNASLAGDLLATPRQFDSGQKHELQSWDVAFEQVTFGYGEAPVLRDIDFVARHGQLTAIVGPSGAGKTTIASLVCRLFDIDKGKITVGGVDVQTLSLEQLRDTVALLPQDPFLFNDTLLENIRIGNPNASDAEIVAAGRAAQLEDFVSGLPDRWQTLLGRGGVTPSGGEKQRIAIARLLLKNAPIVVLDEATAFLDADNEIALVKAIEALAKNRTVIVIAHRLNTVRSAGHIIVLDQGQIREQGTHEDLLTRNSLYSELWKSGFHQEHSAASLHNARRLHDA
jgi:ATP-binding cassette, subfamily B, bacterial IrtA/YbtP